jgi:hypothetical protein
LTSHLRNRDLSSMKDKRGADDASSWVAEWPLPTSTTLGSAVRAKGIEREVRSRLRWPLRPHVTVEAGRVVLRMEEDAADAFEAVSTIITGVVAELDELPILPREVEDILSITSHERHKWMKAGRLESIGTRTVKLRGRSKAVTFHVFHPRHIEEILDRDLPELWRSLDTEATVERRKRSAAKAAMARATKRKPKPGEPDSGPGETPKAPLEGWEDFAAEGLLR